MSTALNNLDFTDKPYILRRGDALEVMKTLADKSVDCVITDLPFGTTACAWDSVIPFEPMWKELKRICKPKAAICLFGSQPFTSLLIGSNIKNFRHGWVWNKRKSAGFAIAKFRPMQIHEEITVFGQESPHYFPIMVEREAIKSRGTFKATDSSPLAYDDGKNRTYTHWYPKSILDFSNANQNGRVHPTQKPVELLRYLIRTYTQENETVLDFTMGSGTCGIACVIEKRKFFGIERDEKYFEIAEARIKRANLEPCDIPQRQDNFQATPLFDAANIGAVIQD